jgi:transposase
MGAPYSQDLRDRVLAAGDRGMAATEVAEVFDVSESWVRRVWQRRRQSGETTPRPMGGATVIKIDTQRLTQLVREKPDATLAELRAMLGAACTESAVCMALKRLGVSFKKSRSTRPSRTAPTSPSGAPRGSRTGPPSTPRG